MSIDLTDPRILLGIIVALITWIILREISRSDKLSQRVAHLEQHAITEGELQVKLAEISAERLRLHEENKEKLDRIINTTDGIHNQAVSIATLTQRMNTMEEHVTDLRRWKHHDVGPYVPKVVEDHDRRLRILEGT